MVKYKSVEILENKHLVDNIYKMVIREENSIKPGQFYMLKVKNSLLQRPISICEKDGDKLTFLYAVVGKGTEELRDKKSSEFIEVTGPLGNGFKLDESLGKVAIVTGGIGIAPMYQVAKELKESKNSTKIDLFSGFRDNIYLTEAFEKYVDSINISTDTGKFGKKGFVIDILNPKDYDTVLCCGPEIMMKNVVNMCKEQNVKVFVSMEKHMACGVGACLVCTCKTKDGNKRTCKDGPVFDGYYVEF